MRCERRQSAEPARSMIVRVLSRRSGQSGIVSLRVLRRPSCYDRMSCHQRQTSQSEAAMIRCNGAPSCKNTRFIYKVASTRRKAFRAVS